MSEEVNALLNEDSPSTAGGENSFSGWVNTNSLNGNPPYPRFHGKFPTCLYNYQQKPTKNPIVKLSSSLSSRQILKGRNCIPKSMRVKTSQKYDTLINNTISGFNLRTSVISENMKKTSTLLSPQCKHYPILTVSYSYDNY